MAAIIGLGIIAVIAIVLVLIFAVFKHEHKWIYETTKVVTCTEDGIQYRTCDGCGTTECITLYSPWDGHVWESWNTDGWVTTFACLTNGFKERVCTRCGYKETQTIPANGSHTFYSFDAVILKEATCTEEGLKETVCAYCDEKETKIIPYAHEYVNGICTKCNRGLINVIFPNTPITVYDFNYDGSIDETCKITSLAIKEVKKNYNGTYSITFIWAGEKTYDDDGNNYSSSVGFVYKLYDSEGYVVHDSSVSSVGVKVGEKFKNQEFGPSYKELDPNETYTMEII
jgi:hypothetical protein